MVQIERRYLRYNSSSIQDAKSDSESEPEPKSEPKPEEENNKEDKKIQKKEKKPKQKKEPSTREKATKAAKKVAKWAVGKQKSSVIGKYKPQIAQQGKGNDRSGGAYTRTVPDIREREIEMGGFGGFHNSPYGSAGSFSHDVFNNAPFSSGLNPSKKIRSWGPPKGF
jgi:membrane-bound lytic murein transglycosylase